MVDKVDQFRRELADPSQPAAERLTALKFLLHLIGDLHQPLHAADDGDRGGNGKRLAGAGHARNLHAFWDTTAVVGLGVDPAAVADHLTASVTPAQAAAWSGGTPASWAAEAFQLAKVDAYGRLPPPDANDAYELDDEYGRMAGRDAALQLSRAGVRLAALLNGALAHDR